VRKIAGGQLPGVIGYLLSATAVSATPRAEELLSQFEYLFELGSGAPAPAQDVLPRRDVRNEHAVLTNRPRASKVKLTGLTQNSQVDPAV
jgi:hypothetical protein